MIMKIWIIVLSALLMCSNLWAEEKKVELDKKVIPPQKQNRSDLSINLEVFMDGSDISFYSDRNIENMYVWVKKTTGETVMSDTASLVTGQTYTFSIGDVVSDIYVLEVKIEDTLYYGYLEIY